MVDRLGVKMKDNIKLEIQKGRSKLLEAKAYSFLKEVIFYDEK